MVAQSPAPEQAVWRLYVLRCGDGTLYAGISTDVQRRLRAHAAGKGARYVRGRGPLILLRSWSYLDESAARKAEVRFKRLVRRRKLQYLLSDDAP